MPSGILRTVISLSGTVRMIDAILVFVYIAIGVGFTLSVYNNMIGGLVL